MSCSGPRRLGQLRFDTEVLSPFRCQPPSPRRGKTPGELLAGVLKGNPKTQRFNLFVFPTLAGPSARVFDWGTAILFGCNIFVAIEGRQTPAGVGPFVAYLSATQ